MAQVLVPALVPVLGLGLALGPVLALEPVLGLALEPVLELVPVPVPVSHSLPRLCWRPVPPLTAVR